MKNFKRITALLLVMAMVIALGVCSMTASAEEVTADEYYTSASASETAHFADYPLETFKVDAHRISMKAPRMDMFFSMNSTNMEVSEIISGRYLKDIINYGDLMGNCYSYVYSTASSTNDVSSYMVYYSNFFTKFMGDFSRMSDEELQDLCESKPFFEEANAIPEVHVINGQKYLYQEYLDNETGKYSYALETIIDGGMYEIHISCTAPTNEDTAKIKEMLSSVKIGGFRNSYTNTASLDAFIVLCVITVLLAAAVIFLLVVVLRMKKELMPAKKEAAIEAADDDASADTPADETAQEDAPDEE
ncbi:MAG: hypothetical protein IJP17_07840 [Clostridia bacterium]|nr:hypothetical protein [Clostridia bacterium]